MLMDHQLFCLKIEKVKSYMLMISFIKNIHNLKKLQWIIKKFKEKNGGYLVNKLESYQHFVCG